MKLYFSLKILLEVVSDVFVNLTSVYFAALLAIPLFGNVGDKSYFEILTANLPLAILGLILSYYLRLKSRK